MRKFFAFALALTAILISCSKSKSTLTENTGSVGNQITTSPAPPPVASFKILNTVAEGTVKEGAAIVVQNTSQNATGYLWDFGNGNYSAEKEPVGMMLYPCTSTSVVKLTVTNKDGVYNTITVPFYVACYRTAGRNASLDFSIMPANWHQH